mmetsp:Transcript_119697/g.168457  ORF Transcript_119697/g.168457 Transcript_119697/m.168457 type:complete len:104 (-) Transcript_119697:60-371(-)
MPSSCCKQPRIDDDRSSSIFENSWLGHTFCAALEDVTDVDSWQYLAGGLRCEKHFGDDSRNSATNFLRKYALAEYCDGLPATQTGITGSSSRAGASTHHCCQP